MKNKFLRAVLLQFSTIMGAGIFALPYFLYYSNFKMAIVGLLIIATIIATVNTFYVEIICQTKGDHQLSGYAQKYLGKKFKYLALVSLIISGIGALLAYLKLGSNFLQILFETKSLTSILIFLSLIFFGHLVKIGKVKNFLEYLPFLSVIIVIFLLKKTIFGSFVSIDEQKFNLSFFGISVFALSGFTIIPEMEEIIRGDKKILDKLKKASILGLLLAVLSYIAFSFSIIKLSGVSLSEDSVTGLGQNLPLIAKVVALLGLLITFKGSINFMRVFHEIFYRDLKSSKKVANLMSLALPLVALLLIRVTLGSAMGIIGAGSVVMSTIIICLMKVKIDNRPKTKLFAGIIITIFILGLIIQ